MNTTILCKVKNCRYNKYHLTKRHQCGRCFLYGHGQIECANPERKAELIQFDTDILDVNLYCKNINCIDPDTHITNGHNCKFCYSKNLHKKRCPINTNENIPICDSEEHLKQYNLDLDKIAFIHRLQIGECIQLLGCMGSTWYIRANIDTVKIEYIMIHSDSWGQYGDDTTDVYRLNAFINNYTLRIINSSIEFNLDLDLV